MKRKNTMTQKILVTGGAGFIGSAVVRYLIKEGYYVINVDKLTYAGNIDSLTEVIESDFYSFEHVDICNSKLMTEIFNKHKPDKVMHLAAESHVDRSIDGPMTFIETNVLGTSILLETAKEYWHSLDLQKQRGFRFHHISTDEVFGDLEGPDNLFTEDTPYMPSSPYSASKASSDHLVRAWHRTYNLPVLITNCSNNYGPYHFPEKLIPLVIVNALQGRPLPIYGKGNQVRDWLYVEDHATALIKVLMHGEIGETYNIGGHNEKRNIDVVKKICNLLEELHPKKPKGIKNYIDLITYVDDRPGHDIRYAIDASKIKQTLGWVPEESFDTGLRKTVEWYLANQRWWKRVQDGSYSKISTKVIS